jgi:CPA1 family monovalent cation:H+ antiporter
MSRHREFVPHTVKVLTWGGLRGGISVALALWLGQLLGAEHPETRDVLLVMTYAVVVFSIIVQGLTIQRLLGRLGVVDAAQEAEAADAAEAAAEAAVALPSPVEASQASEE